MSFIISIIVFLMLLLGLYSLSNLSLDAMSVDLDMVLNDPQVAIRKRAIRKQKNKKRNFIVRLLSETKVILTAMGRSNKFIVVVIISVILSVIGAVLAVLLGNPYLIPAMVLGCISIPFIFVRTYSYSYQKQLRNELELSLSLVTTSYLRTEDIVKSIEENLDNMNNPVRRVFEEFISQVKFINPNIRQAIDDMSNKVENNIFKEWCECLKKCNQNRTLKYMLVPVVDKYQTLREITGSIQEEINGYRIEYYVILGVVYSSYPIIWLLNKDWFKVLTDTVPGFITNGFVAFIAVLCTVILSFILKPLEYDV